MTRKPFDFEAAFRIIPTPFAVLDRDLRYVEANERYCETLMRGREELIGEYAFDLFPETEERERVIKAGFERALAGEENSIDEIVYSIPVPNGAPGETQEIWWSVHNTPIRDETGAVGYFGLHVEDKTTEVRTRMLKDAVSRELQHRVGNLLTLVLAMARQIAGDYRSTADFLEAFSDRVVALARTHALLTGGDWDGLTIDRLLRRQLEPYKDKLGVQITLKGGELRLSADEAQALSMAVHELTTNAVKYGALRSDEGRVTVSWSAVGERGFELDWEENGRTGVAEPTHAGFGSTMLTKLLPRQLEGAAERSFSRTGFRYRIVVPERARAA